MYTMFVHLHCRYNNCITASLYTLYTISQCSHVHPHAVSIGQGEVPPPLPTHKHTCLYIHLHPSSIRTPLSYIHTYIHTHARTHTYTRTPARTLLHTHYSPMPLSYTNLHRHLYTPTPTVHTCRMSALNAYHTYFPSVLWRVAMSALRSWYSLLWHIYIRTHTHTYIYITYSFLSELPVYLHSNKKS